MLEKVDITGFEKDFFWSDITNNLTYQFLRDGSGVMMDEKDVTSSLNWEFIEEKNAIKIGINGIIVYYIFKEKNKDEFLFNYRTKNKNIDVKLIRSAINPNEAVKAIAESKTEPNLEKVTLEKLDIVDKITLGFFYFTVFVIFIIILKLSLFTKGMSVFMTLLIAFILTTLSLIKTKDIAFYFSRKYKKELEKIIFKK